MPSSLPLPRSTPESRGVDSAALSRLVAALDTAADVELHSLMIVRNGAVIAEGYWEPYQQDQIQLLYSLSKSFTSTAAGMAAAEGMLSLDDKVVDVFDDLAECAADDRVRQITLRHCLRMATGHREDVLPPAYQASPDDLVRGFLMTPPDQEPGSIFCYNNAATYVVGAAVQKVSGQTLTEFLTPRLFRPLGIDRFSWQSDRGGRDIGFSGLHLATESIAKFGQLILQNGVWQGQQLLDPHWLSEATALQTDTSENDNPDWQAGYGFQFWMARHGFRGDGAYGQFCVILPERDVVVAITEATQNTQSVLDLLWEHLLPACRGAADSTAATPEAEALAEQLRALTLTPVNARDWSPLPLAEPEGPLVAPVAEFRIGEVQPVDQDHVRVTVGHDPLTVGQSPIELTFECGLSGWRAGMINFVGRVPGRVAPDTSAGEATELAYAASGSHREDGSFVAEIAFLQTPHRMRIERDADGTSRTGWLTLPLGPALPEALAIRTASLSQTHGAESGQS